ncbi:SRPBCC domain-containing protein [Devosia lacusdianchii]|uniref:SRPBCC domain-containing protein n=1 Tax=Devosia lacusdianchii TaxID=2917991 RepID=UPI001F070C7D|nr:SRPBCC domain-containing protein [Devosia sp. JXJ CY 41]
MTDGRTKIDAESKTLTFSRWFRAPRLLVWKSFEDPYLLAQWWGPEGFTCPIAKLDFRVGGEWHTVIRSPDGIEIPSVRVFTDIRRPERIAYRSVPRDDAFWNGNPPPAYSTVLSFFERDGGTELVMKTEFETEQQAQDAMVRGFAEGVGQTLDKLGRLLLAQTG